VFAETQAFSGFAVDDVEKAEASYGETLGIATSTQKRPADAAPRRYLRRAGQLRSGCGAHGSGSSVY
jgi:hypothetical protein